MTRNRLLKAVNAVQNGMAPPGLDEKSQRVRAFSSVMPRSAPLQSAPEMQVAKRKSE
jgi:hypothetical protein